jgi:hypothetical protein
LTVLILLLATDAYVADFAVFAKVDCLEVVMFVLDDCTKLMIFVLFDCKDKC